MLEIIFKRFFFRKYQEPNAPEKDLTLKSLLGFQRNQHLDSFKLWLFFLAFPKVDYQPSCSRILHLTNKTWAKFNSKIIHCNFWEYSLSISNASGWWLPSCQRPKQQSLVKEEKWLVVNFCYRMLRTSVYKPVSGLIMRTEGKAFLMTISGGFVFSPWSLIANTTGTCSQLFWMPLCTQFLFLSAILNCICVRMCVCIHIHVCLHKWMCTWSSEDNSQELVLSFSIVGPGIGLRSSA